MGPRPGSARGGRTPPRGGGSEQQGNDSPARGSASARGERAGAQQGADEASRLSEAVILGQWGAVADSGMAPEQLERALSQVYELKLRGESLTRIESLSRCTRLRQLDLSGNHIVYVEGLNALQELRELKLCALPARSPMAPPPASALPRRGGMRMGRLPPARARAAAQAVGGGRSGLRHTCQPHPAASDV